MFVIAVVITSVSVVSVCLCLVLYTCLSVSVFVLLIINFACTVAINKQRPWRKANTLHISHKYYYKCNNKSPSKLTNNKHQTPTCCALSISHFGQKDYPKTVLL